MISLFLNTFSNYLNIVLIKNEEVIDEIYKRLDKDLSKEALSNIKEVLQRNNLSPDSINEIIIARGPGSFIGLRVGATIAKVFAYFKNIKLFPYHHLKLWQLLKKEK